MGLAKLQSTPVAFHGRCARGPTSPVFLGLSAVWASPLQVPRGLSGPYTGITAPPQSNSSMTPSVFKTSVVWSPFPSSAAGSRCCPQNPFPSVPCSEGASSAMMLISLAVISPVWIPYCLECFSAQQISLLALSSTLRFLGHGQTEVRYLAKVLSNGS